MNLEVFIVLTVLTIISIVVATLVKIQMDRDYEIALRNIRVKEKAVDALKSNVSIKLDGADLVKLFKK